MWLLFSPSPVSKVIYEVRVVCLGKDAKKEGSGPHAVGSGHLRQWDQHLEDPGLLTSRYLILSNKKNPIRGLGLESGLPRGLGRLPERGLKSYSEG